jgi:uncharacterized membrane protein
MTTRTFGTSNPVARWTLSVPVQATLFLSLSALTIWTVYFTTYPAAHDKVHSLRHHTALISCH